MSNFTFIDIFAGIGGMRIPLDMFGGQCVFSSEIDRCCQRVYEMNFKETPHSDITQIDPLSIPDHDVLLAGFPCQSFSIMGHQKGFQDTRGTLFFSVEKVLEAKRPRACLLENVKQLYTHDSGNTYRTIEHTLHQLGYTVYTTILNSLDFGVPQKRERVYIVGLRDGQNFEFPKGKHSYDLTKVLEESNTIAPRYFASSHIVTRRQERYAGHVFYPSIWHENKSGNISVLPYSCALRAHASHNYLLVNGIRRLTEREMCRLQGFPDSFKIPNTYAQTRRQMGNTVTIPVIEAIQRNMLSALEIDG